MTEANRSAVEVINRQRQRPVDCQRWTQFAEQALSAIGQLSETGATIVFVSDTMIRRLNRDYRCRNTATDVLSFPIELTAFEKQASTSLGDVVISVERAAAQAAEHNLEFEQEVAQLILHGLLHLCGYDHEADNGEMNRLELRLRRRLGI